MSPILASSPLSPDRACAICRSWIFILSFRSSVTTAARRKQSKDSDCQVVRYTDHLLHHNTIAMIPQLTPFLRVSKVLLFQFWHFRLSLHYCDHGGTTPVMRAYATSCPICSFA